MEKPIYLYGVRAKPEFGGLYQYAEASDPQEAFAKLGLTENQVRRYASIKRVDNVKTMPDEVKEKLMQINEERRALRKVRPNRKEETLPAEQPTKAEVKGSANGAEGKTMKTKKVKKATPKLDVLREMQEAKALSKPVAEIRESKKLLAENTAMDSKEKAKKPSKKKEAVKKSAPAKKTETKKDEPEIKGELLKESDGFKFDGRVEYFKGILRTELAYKVAPWAKALNWCRNKGELVGVMVFESAKERDAFKEHSKKKAA